MTWVKLDTRAFLCHHVTTVGNAAFGAWIRMVCYSHEGWDCLPVGFFPDSLVKTVAKKREVQALVLAGMLNREEGGYSIPPAYRSTGAEESYPGATYPLVLPCGSRPSRPYIDRTAILERDEWRCAYCGTALDETNAHVDHVIPFSQGGHSDPSNLAAACKPCNLAKGAKTPWEWRPDTFSPPGVAQ